MSPRETDLQDSDVLNDVIASMKRLSPEERERVFRAVATFFELGLHRSSAESGSLRAEKGLSAPPVRFSEDIDVPPKDFILQKQPRTDVERIATLAYYLTHYRGLKHFRTLDLSKLNTEAAQPKFANATWASDNALKLRYLASATKGTRQISAAGEQFVTALPDRDLARKAMERMRPRRRSKRRARKPSEGQG